MYLDRPYPLSTTDEETEMNRSTSGGSVSEDDSRQPEQQQEAAADKMEVGGVTAGKKKQHRRGKKRCRPKWKPYSKMTLDERKQLDEWEENHVAIREAQINARSKRPVAPFNSTQFLIEDRSENQLRIPTGRPSRTMSYDSSSGDDVHYEPSDDDLEEQEAFLEADFNQVYLQLKMNRLEGMSKQDLVNQCCNLEDKVSSIEQEKLELLARLQKLEQANGGELRDGELTTTSQ